MKTLAVLHEKRANSTSLVDVCFGSLSLKDTRAKCHEMYSHLIGGHHQQVDTATEERKSAEQMDARKNDGMSISVN